MRRSRSQKRSGGRYLEAIVPNPTTHMRPAYRGVLRFRTHYDSLCGHKRYRHPIRGMDGKEDYRNRWILRVGVFRCTDDGFPRSDSTVKRRSHRIAIRTPPVIFTMVRAHNRILLRREGKETLIAVCLACVVRSRSPRVRADYRDRASFYKIQCRHRD